MKAKLIQTTFIAMTACSVQATPVEMMLSDRLDGNLDSYCIDISGSKQNANLDKGLQTHTCYSYQGSMGIDQIFDADKLSENKLYMPEFDVCATVSTIQPGATIGLAACDGSDEQTITLTEEGYLSPVVAMTLCLTAGSETKLGRGGTSAHQIKSLSLEVCDEDQAAYQRWEIRS